MNVKEIRLGDLFVISNSKGVNANQVKFGGSYPYVTRTEKDNGIAGYIYADNLDKINPANTISFGQDTWTLFYQSEPYFTGNRVKILKLKDENFKLTEEVALYLITAMKKVLVGLTWGTSKNEVNFENRTICLPVTSSGEIDWQYMQERIAELEQERIAELEHYLVASGLNDYELTEEDKSILATELFNGDDATELPSENGCRKEARKFKISDVFDLCKGKRLIKSEHIYGNTPFIGSTDSNNGVTGYIGQEPIFSGNAITISYNGSVGQVFYQENDFWASDDINVLYLKNHVLNALLYGYLSGALKKAGSKFSYSYKWNLKRMKETLITLPIQTNADHTPIIDPENKYHPEGYIPDWSFMEKYIRAVEKVVIKDVVDWKDEEIKKTIEIVS